MNNKFSRLLQPSMRLYFIVLVLFALASATVNYKIAIAEGAIIVVLFIYSKITSNKQRNRILDYVEELSYSVESVKKDNMINLPMPMVIFRLDNSEIVWSNDSFAEMTGERERLFERRLSDSVPNLSVKWLAEGKPQAPELTEVGGKKYQIYGNIVRTESDTEGYRFLGITYWIDVTEYAIVQQEYGDSRPVCALIVLDNYEEFIKNTSEKDKSLLLASVDDKISAWTEGADGILCKLDRDEHLFIFEERHMDRLVSGKFSLLGSVRELVSPGGIPATVSIGIGRSGDSFFENYAFARLGIEMSLSRGGDQAVIKNKYSFEFFGGHSSSQEKRTKVKARVMASSLTAFVREAENVFIMGHKFADMDSLGAAAAVNCIARKFGVNARIVIDLQKNAAGQMLSLLKEAPEYADTFISPKEAILMAGSRSLLVVVDTNRPDQVESEDLLDACHNVAVIDHHRRAADYIENPVISFHEPYASSTCELMTELLQYIADQQDLLRVEAEAIMAGIVMDTKNFTLRTGSRTFEAAAFLRRAGASTTEVKRLMQNDFTGTVARYNIIRQAKLYSDGIAIVALSAPENRIVAAQAADELLNISGIQASFVLYPDADGVVMSARSIDKINVQAILEKLGGGGNRSAAGAQIAGKSMSEALASLRGALDQYSAENQ